MTAKLVVIAVRAESSGEFEAADVPYLLCGVGKVNAAIALTHELIRYTHALVRMPMVMNCGTAGSRIHPAGSMVECYEFIQRDMDARELGFPLGGQARFHFAVTSAVERLDATGGLQAAFRGDADNARGSQSIFRR